MKHKQSKNALVVTSNDLVYAKYDWSLWQKRVFIYAISQIEKESKIFEPIKIHIKDVLNFYNSSDAQTSYKAIIEAPKKLSEGIEIPYISEEGEKRIAYISVFKFYTIPEKVSNENQYIEIVFNDDLKPHLLDLKEKFLKYDVKNIVGLQSIYSFRMFEILKSYEFRKEIELELEYLRDILGITGMYKQYGEFKTFVIEKAQRDFLDYCDISFTFKAKKEGRKITSLLFFISKNKPKKRENQERETSTEYKEKVLPQETNEQEKIYNEFSSVVINDFGVTPMALSKIIQEYDPERIRKQIRIIQRKMKKGGATNIAGLFMEAVKNDYNDPEEAKEIKKQERQNRSEQIKLLQMEQDDIKIDFEEKKNEKIRELTNNNPSITTEAIQTVISEPLGKKRLQMIGITDPETDDFRKDTILRIMVKNAIVNAQKGEFLEIVEDYTSRTKAIEDKIKVLSK